MIKVKSNECNITKEIFDMQDICANNTYANTHIEKNNILFTLHN